MPAPRFPGPPRVAFSNRFNRDLDSQYNSRDGVAVLRAIVAAIYCQPRSESVFAMYLLYLEPPSLLPYACITPITSCYILPLFVKSERPVGRPGPTY